MSPCTPVLRYWFLARNEPFGNCVVILDAARQRARQRRPTDPHGGFTQASKLSPSDPPAFRLSLRIRHPSIDPADLSREFDIEAEHSFRAGDPRPWRGATIPASVHAESYWLGALDPADWPPDISFPGQQRLRIAAEHFRKMATNSLGWALSLSADRFFRLHAELLRRLRSDGAQISLLVALPAGGLRSFSLAPEVSRVFGEFGIAVEFEFIKD